MDLFIYLNGEKRGPFAEERVRQMLAEGFVRATDLAATDAAGELKPLNLLLSPAREAAFVRQEQPTPVPAPAAPEATRLPSTALGPYSRATLAPNETPFLRTSLHWIIFARFAFWGLILFVLVALPFAIGVQALTGSEIGWFALPLPILVLIPPAIAYAGSELVVTNMRVLIKTGVVRRQTLEMFISKIESIAVDQGFFGRIFDYGTVLIRGTGGFQEPFATIARPLEFRNSVQRLQSAHNPPAAM